MHRHVILLTSLALGACGTASPPADAPATDAAADHTGHDAPDMSDPDGAVTPRNRDFTLRGREFDPADGRALRAWVVDSTGYHVMGLAVLAAAAGPQFEIRMPDLLPDGDYHADVFVDGNGNGQYDGASSDPSWRLPIPSTGSATVQVTPSASVTDIATPPRSPRLDFAIRLTGFAADEAGQRFELRVIDQGSARTVGTYIHPRLPAGDALEVRLPGIVEEGHGYNVDFWVDVDASGTYSGPGADHTWRQAVTAGASGVNASWTHTDEHVELNWR